MGLQDRWSGALAALNRETRTAARRFYTSAREILTAIMDAEGPATMVVAPDVHYIRTPNDGVSRAKIR